MLDNIINDVQLIKWTIIHYLNLTVGIIVFMLVVNCFNKITNNKLSILGIIPRNIFGLVGIVCAPFLHGNFNHLFFNCIPLFFLMNMILISGFNVFLSVTLIIMFWSGFLTWLFGRHAIHLGSSSVIMGYFGFLSIYAFLSPNFLSLLLLVLCLYYFGGLVIALIPTNAKGVSEEGHIFGYLSGVIAYFYWPAVLGYLQYLRIV